MDAIVGECFAEAFRVGEGDAAVAQKSLRRGLAGKMKALDGTKLGSKLGE